MKPSRNWYAVISEIVTPVSALFVLLAVGWDDLYLLVVSVGGVVAGVAIAHANIVFTRRWEQAQAMMREQADLQRQVLDQNRELRQVNEQLRTQSEQVRRELFKSKDTIGIAQMLINGNRR